MNGNKILVTGGTGYIGRELISVLLANIGNNVAVVVRDIVAARNVFQEQVKYISSNEKDLKKNITNFSPNIVIHLAAYSSSSDTIDDIKKLIESNIIFTSILLDAISECKIDLFINTGSFSEYHYNTMTASPTYFYSATKTAAKYIIEYFSKKNNFKFINAILYTVYGKRSDNKKIIDYAIDSLNNKITIKMSDGKQILDFIHIDDIVNFYTNLVYNYKNLNITQNDYFVGTGKGITIREIVHILEENTNKKANIQWGAKNRKLDTIQAVANIVNTVEDLKWSPKVNIATGIKKYINSLNGVYFE